MSQRKAPPTWGSERHGPRLRLTPSIGRRTHVALRAALDDDQQAIEPWVPSSAGSSGSRRPGRLPARASHKSGRCTTDAKRPPCTAWSNWREVKTKRRSDETNGKEIRIEEPKEIHMKTQKAIRMKHLAVAAAATVAAWLATPAWADSLFFSNDTPGKPIPTLSRPGGARVTFPDVTRLVNNGGVFNNNGLVPQVRITSPLDGAFIAPGDSRLGAGDPNGTGMAIVAEIHTRDNIGVTVDEDVNIRNVNDLGGLNPKFPGLFVFIDEDLITPNGTIIPANTNLGPLFNIAGTDDTPGPGVTIWAGWHVLESIRPEEGGSFNLTVAVVDDAGRVAFDRV